MMQIGLNTTNATASAPLRTRVDAPEQTRRVTTDVTGQSGQPFPEAALLSRRPLRYNVQLNQQLTAVQQADNYLAQTETRLLKLRQSSAGGDVREMAGALQKHLEQRSALSGGTVDRHFRASVQQKSMVNFSLPGSEAFIQPSGGETLLFSLGGNGRDLAAVVLPEDATPSQRLVRLNVGLGRLGIHARQAENGQLTFSVEESRWARVSQHLSVRGGGNHYPADAFTVLAPQAEASGGDEMIRLSTAGWERGSHARVQKALDDITAQRSMLHHHQERVTARISDMSTVYDGRQARETARALGGKLADGGGSYQALSQALGAQANLSLSTIKNLLT